MTLWLCWPSTLLRLCHVPTQVPCQRVHAPSHSLPWTRRVVHAGLCAMRCVPRRLHLRRRSDGEAVGGRRPAQRPVHRHRHSQIASPVRRLSEATRLQSRRQDPPLSPRALAPRALATPAHATGGVARACSSGYEYSIRAAGNATARTAGKISEITGLLNPTMAERGAPDRTSHPRSIIRAHPRAPAAVRLAASSMGTAHTCLRSQTPLRQVTATELRHRCQPEKAVRSATQGGPRRGRAVFLGHGVRRHSKRCGAERPSRHRKEP